MMSRNSGHGGMNHSRHDDDRQSSTHPSPTTHSLATMASRPGVEDEKCVVAQFRTTAKQREDFAKLLEQHPRNKIPLEWIIDIADETSGWFYATAYDYDDSTNMLHIMVPDKTNPTFDGKVVLDHRTVHLIECVDGKSDALFNRIVRDSVIKVKWDVEWFEEDNDSNEDLNGGVKGRWIASSARYYIRIANQILVEDTYSGDGIRGYVMLLADQNVRLLHCHKGRGLEDFSRLISENVVQHIPEALDAGDVPPSMDDLDLGEIYGQKSSENIVMGSKPVNMKGRGSISGNINTKPSIEATHKYSPKESDHSQSFSSSDMSYLRKLVDMSRGLRECINDLLDERDSQAMLLEDLASTFKSFALSGDLKEGLHLIEKSDKIIAKKETRENKGSSNNHDNDDEINYDFIAEDTWKLSNKLERGLIKHMKNQADFSNMKDMSKEVDHMKRMINKMKQEIDDRDEEIRMLRSNNRMR